VSYCAGCGQPAQTGDHAACARRQEQTDTPRFCTICGRKLKVQVLPFGWRAECVRCGVLSPGDRSA
jgi:hypothetical protein